MDFKFTFNLVKPKKVKTDKKVSKCICYAVSFRDKNNEWKAYTLIEEKNSSKYEIYPFTPESHDLTDKTHIFTKNKTKEGYVMRVRNKFDAHNCPVPEEYYSPFCNYNVYKGHLKIIDDKIYFHLEEFIECFSQRGAEYMKIETLDKLKEMLP